MPANIRNMSVAELANLKKSMIDYERQLAVDIPLLRSEADRLESLLAALTAGVDEAPAETVTEEGFGMELYLASKGKKVPAGKQYDLLDGDDNVVARLVGKGRSWRVMYQGNEVARGGSKQEAINNFEKEA